MIIFDKNLYVSLTLQKNKPYFTKIALKPLHTNLFNIVLLSIFLTIGSCKLYSQDITKNQTAIPSKNQTNSTAISVDNSKKSIVYINNKESDTIKKDSI